MGKIPMIQNIAVEQMVVDIQYFHKSLAFFAPSCKT